MNPIWNKLLAFGRKAKQGQLFGPRRGFSFRVAGVHVNEDSAMQVSAYHRGVIYIATQIAKLPWNVKDKKQNILWDSKIMFLLNVRPNAEMTAFKFRLWLIINAINNGNAYAEIERDIYGVPIALWPIGRQEMEPVRDVDTGQLYYRFTGRTNGRQVLISPNDIFHVGNFHTKDGIISEGLVAYAERTLGISLAADRMASSLFANGGIPSGFLKHKGKLSDDAYKRLKESWTTDNSRENAGGTALLEEGTEYQTIDIDPTVLQFLESRKFGVLEAARFLNVHPTKLFDITAATYSNVENANLEMATDVLDSWARNIEAEADAKLLNDSYGGKFTELDLYQIFRGDAKTRAEYNTKMMQMGAMSPNEVREREGMAGYKGGDRLYIATNNFTPVDRMDEVIDAQIKSKTTPATNTPPSPDKSKAELQKEEDDAAIAKAVLEVLNRKK